MTTPRLELSELLQNQSQPHVTVNNMARRLDALVQAVALAIITELPSSFVDGDSYLVAPSGTTGSLVGKEDNFVYYYGGWQYIPPFDGFRVYVHTHDEDYRYSAVNSPAGWAAMSGGGGGSASILFDQTATANPSGAETDYNPTGWLGATAKSRLRITPAGGGSTINSLDATNAVDGQTVAIFNEGGADNVTAANAGAGVAANTFECPGAVDQVILPKQGRLIQRCGNKWRFVS